MRDDIKLFNWCLFMSFIESVPRLAARNRHKALTHDPDFSFVTSRDDKGKGRSGVEGSGAPPLTPQGQEKPEILKRRHAKT